MVGRWTMVAALLVAACGKGSAPAEAEHAAAREHATTAATSLTVSSPTTRALPPLPPPSRHPSCQECAFAGTCFVFTNDPHDTRPCCEPIRQTITGPASEEELARCNEQHRIDKETAKRCHSCTAYERGNRCRPHVSIGTVWRASPCCEANPPEQLCSDPSIEPVPER